jgi:hypothetical protein
VAETEAHIVMLIVSGYGEDTQWFDYKPGYFADVIRIEWDKNTMSVVLPSDAANYLLAKGYARPMTEAELAEYTAPPPPVEEKEEKPARKKGNSS